MDAANRLERNLFQFAFATGLRTSELIALEWRDIDLKKQTATISRAFTAGVDKGPKTEAGYRIVELSQPALAALKAQHSHSFFKKGRVFLYPRTGEPFQTDKQIREWLWRPLLERAEV